MNYNLKLYKLAIRQKMNIENEKGKPDPAKEVVYLDSISAMQNNVDILKGEGFTKN